MIGVQGGRYHGAVTEINENEILVVRKEEKDEKGETVYITEPIDVNTLILGDYITYIGTDAETELVEGGRLTTSTLYEWVGKSSDRLYMWKQDVMSEHCGGSLSDALAVSNESLAKNNSTAFQFLDHLTANSIFVNKLVANDAFIKNLFAENIKATGSIRVGERYDENGNVVTDKEGKELDVSGAYIGGDGTLKANKAVLTNIEAEGGKFTDVNISGFFKAKGGYQISNLSSIIYDRTETEKDKIKDAISFMNGVINDLRIDTTKKGRYEYLCSCSVLYKTFKESGYNHTAFNYLMIDVYDDYYDINIGMSLQNVGIVFTTNENSIWYPFECMSRFIPQYDDIQVVLSF